jgi:hypothetical protein
MAQRLIYLHIKAEAWRKDLVGYSRDAETIKKPSLGCGPRKLPGNTGMSQRFLDDF